MTKPKPNDLNFLADWTKSFRCGRDILVLEYQSDSHGTSWRLKVNGKTSPTTRHYPGVLVFGGYGVTTEYWKDTLPEVFRIVPAEPYGD
jgi:hypothetical protein